MDGCCLSSMAFLTIAWSCFASQSAIAYIGPGAGLSAIGVLLAIMVGIVVAIVGFVWYPIKRLMRRLRRAAPRDDLKEGSKA